MHQQRPLQDEVVAEKGPVLLWVHRSLGISGYLSLFGRLFAVPAESQTQRQKIEADRGSGCRNEEESAKFGLQLGQQHDEPDNLPGPRKLM